MKGLSKPDPLGIRRRTTSFLQSRQVSGKIFRLRTMWHTSPKRLNVASRTRKTPGRTILIDMKKAFDKGWKNEIEVEVVGSVVCSNGSARTWTAGQQQSFLLDYTAGKKNTERRSPAKRSPQPQLDHSILQWHRQIPASKCPNCYLCGRSLVLKITHHKLQLTDAINAESLCVYNNQIHIV